MTNEDLLQAYQSGDEAAFTTLVENCLPIAYRYANRELGDHQQAEDVCQLVFSSLAGLGPRSQEIRSVAAWVFSCTRRQIALMIRKESRRRKREHVAVELGHAHPEGDHESIAIEEILPSLRASLAELPGRDQDALFLRYYEGQSFRQVGESLGIREHAAQKRVQRAIERLQGLLSARGITSVAGLLGSQLFTAGAAEVPHGLASNIASQALRNPVAPASFSLSALLTTAAIPGLAMIAAVSITLLASKALVSKPVASSQASETTTPTNLLTDSRAFGLAIDDIEGIYQLAPGAREEALVKLTTYLGSRNEADYLSDLFRRWTVLDPGRNAEALVDLIRKAESGSERQAFLAPLLDIPLHRWASQDLGDSRTWVMALPRTDYAEAYAHESLLRFLTAQDIEAAYTLLTSRGLVRSETVEIVAQGLLQLPLSDVLNLLVQWKSDRSQVMPSERDRDLTFRHEPGETKRSLLRAVIPTLYQQDPKAVATWLEERASGEALNASLLAAWAENDPVRALEWGLKSSAGDLTMLEPAFHQWLEQAPADEPILWLESHAETIDSPALFEIVAAKLDPHAGLKWSESLPKPEQRAAVRRQAFYLFGQGQPDVGRALLESQKPLDVRATEAFAWGAFVSHGRRYLTDWRSDLEPTSDLFAVLTAAEINLIAALKPSLAYKMVRALPPGATRDRASESLLDRTMHRSIEDAEQAEAWATELLSATLKAEYKQKIETAKQALASRPLGVELPKIPNTDFSDQPLVELEARLNTLSTIPSSELKR